MQAAHFLALYAPYLTTHKKRASLSSACHHQDRVRRGVRRSQLHSTSVEATKAPYSLAPSSFPNCDRCAGSQFGDTGALPVLEGFSFLFFTGRDGSFLSQRRERKEWGRKICLLLSFRERKERDFTASLSFSYRAKLLCFNRNDFATVVVAASLARSVRQARLAALRASDDAGDRQFPVGAASLISSRAGYFSLGYCHLVHLLG